METNRKITRNELKNALIDVRKAYRLVYEHQRRVLSLIGYIQSRLVLKSNGGGNKFFSDELKTKNNDYPKLWCTTEEWAWDFLYSYMFEFYCGFKTVDKLDKEFNISIIEVCDSGFWEKGYDNSTATETVTFEDAEKSDSYLIFVFESTNLKDKEYYWKDKKELGRLLYEFLYSKEPEKIEAKPNQNMLFLKKVSMDCFINQDETDKEIALFSQKIKECTGIDILGA